MNARTRDGSIVGRRKRFSVMLACVTVAAGCRATAPGAPPVVAARAPAPVTPPPAPPLPELVLRAGEPAWRAMGISIVISSPAATEASLDALSAKLAVPTPMGHALLEALTGSKVNLRGVPLRRVLVDRLDPALPLVFVALAPGIGVSGGYCWGLAFRDAADARRTLDELGVETARRGGESTRRLPDGSVANLGVHGRTLLFSPTARLISVAGPLVEALQARGAAHVATISLYPQAMPVGAAVLGGSLETLLTSALRKERARRAAAPANAATPLSITDGLVAITTRMARMLGSVVADTRAARLELDLDEQVGLALRVVVEPVEGSALARSVAERTPIRVDPRVRTSDGNFVFAWGASTNPSSWLGVLDATGPAGRTFHADTVAWRRLFVGPLSCAGDLGLGAITSVCAQPLARGVKTADIFRRYAAYARDATAMIKELGIAGPPAPKIKVARDVLEVEQDTDVPGEAGPVRARRHELLGGVIRHTVLMTRPAEGLVAWAPDRAAATAALAARAAPAPPPSAALAAVLARAEGADLALALDLVSLLKGVFEATTDPKLHAALVMLRAIHGFDELHAPVGLTSRTGARAAYELHLPFETLRNVAGLMRPYMGVMGATPRP
jgi:hypothetical protein